MIFSRRRKLRKAIEEAQHTADQHLADTRASVKRIGDLADQLESARLRNHFGESIAESFQTRRRRGFPWTR